MYKFLVFFALVAPAFSLYFPLVDDDDDQLKMLPISPERRQQLKYHIDSRRNAHLGYKGTILDNGNHRVDGEGYVVKYLRGHGVSPDAEGGAVNYGHKPSGLKLGVTADHVRHGSTNVGASGGWNFIQNKDAEVGVSGTYEKSVGGPGPGREDYGVVLSGKVKI